MKNQSILMVILFGISSMFVSQTSAQEPTPANGNNVKEFYVYDVKFTMVEVEGGSFKMTDEYVVTLDTYYIGQTEVTQELYQKVMKKNPSKSVGPQQPVETVSWNNCQKFIKKLNEITGEKFRLPTEAEWTYAAIGGKKSHGYVYSGGNKIDEVGWFQANLEAYNKHRANHNKQQVAGSPIEPEPHDVALKKPNELGIYDMTGNVFEWCQDFYKDKLPKGSRTNPLGPKEGSVHVYRGGGWNSNDETCAVSYRGNGMPSFGYEDVGFRLVLVP